MLKGDSNRYFRLKKIVKVTKKILRTIKKTKFVGTINYWESRYTSNGTSGEGSYGDVAKFKAEIVNEFVNRNNIQTVIEFGCGDGNQILLANYPYYLGFDVSKKAVEICKNKFISDKTKSFIWYDPNLTHNVGNFIKADLTMSLEVIFHLIENSIFQKYMDDLFASSKKYVIIYSSNKEANDPASHVKHRVFTKYIEENIKDFELMEKIPGKYPEKSFADFYIYKKSY